MTTTARRVSTTNFWTMHGVTSPAEIFEALDPMNMLTHEDRARLARGYTAAAREKMLALSAGACMLHDDGSITVDASYGLPISVLCKAVIDELSAWGA